eukprot:353273-Chlamydomonas_euryale.AAC.9
MGTGLRATRGDDKLATNQAKEEGSMPNGWASDRPPPCPQKAPPRRKEVPYRGACSRGGEAQAGPRDQGPGILGRAHSTTARRRKGKKKEGQMRKRRAGSCHKGNATACGPEPPQPTPCRQPGHENRAQSRNIPITPCRARSLTVQPSVYVMLQLWTVQPSVYVMLQLWTVQPPPAKWIRRDQLARNPPQRPPGAEGKGRHKGRTRDRQRQGTDRREAGRKGNARGEARPKEGRRKTGKDWKRGGSEDKEGARAGEDKTRHGGRAEASNPRSPSKAPPHQKAPMRRRHKAPHQKAPMRRRHKAPHQYPGRGCRQVERADGAVAGPGRAGMGAHTRLTHGQAGGEASGLPTDWARRSEARQRTVLAKPAQALAECTCGAAAGFAGRDSCGSRPMPLADAPMPVPLPPPSPTSPSTNNSYVTTYQQASWPSARGARASLR